MTCNLVTLLPCSYLVTLKVGTIYVPIHDVRTAIAVLNVALKTYQLWRRKALRHAFPGMSLKFKEHHPRNSDSHTLGGREQMRAFWALKNLHTRQRHQQISWCSFHNSLCVLMYQSERTCERRYLKSSPNAESASLAVSPFSLSSSLSR